MKKILQSGTGKILVGILGVAVTVVLTLMASSKNSGANENQIKTNTEAIKDVMTIHIPAIDKRVMQLEIDNATAKSDISNMKNDVSETKEMIKTMYEFQLKKPAPKSHTTKGVK